ncbi:hypothetical protein RJ527_02740 [Thalassospiraceae bacterium LMO-SO8]|nr:hypothetical protein [Alphaproteobacteria bacterium LMO-S08]WND76667.1 hypothetical protein RJ527_02740 [Thalassospiraceae bacterium LMO-SO8]
MLFSYPANALASNWLNSTVIDVLIAGMDAIDAGGAPVEWPTCLPNARRTVLRRRTGLRRKLEEFWELYAELNDQEKATVREAIARQTDLPGIYSNHTPCPSLSGLPLNIRPKVRKLFDYLYDQLGEIKEGEECLRDIQYRAIYLSGIRICPFCGLNYFRAPNAPRHALDHLLDKPRYPFSAADLRNLPPTCHECNSTYKHTTDIIHKADGSRRRCSDPYSGPVFSISLAASEFFSGNEIGGWRLPRWEVELVGPGNEQAETWDTVYQIKTRYCRDILDADFLSWIQHFSNWYSRKFGKGTSSAQVADRLPRYIDSVIQDGFADRAFLKAEAFRFVHESCDAPGLGEDVREWLWNFVEYAT